MNKTVRTIALAVTVLLILGGVFSAFKFITGKKFKPEFQKGMCYTTWSKTSYESKSSDASLRKLKEINVEWIAIVITWYQDTCFSTRVFPTAKTPSDESLKHAILEARSLGMKVMLKPHLDIISTEYGSWRGEIACVKEPDWEKWFSDYENFTVHYAKIAEETGAKMFCVGTELTGVTAVHDEKWREVIKAVKKVYKGALTYAANWQEEYLQIKFWDELDYAGIDAYFPLSDKDKPTYEELLEAWKRWLPEIETWQASVGKPVIFPEIGYRSSTMAAREPWEHAPGATADPELQKDCYRAVVDTFWDKKWFYGPYWWSWGTDVRMGGAQNRGFTPQNKPAQGYIEELYKKRVER